MALMEATDDAPDVAYKQPLNKDNDNMCYA